MKKILNYITMVLLFAVLAVSLNNIIDDSQKMVADIYFVQLNKKNEQVTIAVKRKVYKENLFKNVIEELLKGPEQEEIQKGFSSEIPSETKLIDVQNSEKKVVLNLSEDFQYGGGTGSMMIRIKQLVDTVSSATDKPVYLYLEGEQVEAIGGEGIFINQPINVDESK